MVKFLTTTAMVFAGLIAVSNPTLVYAAAGDLEILDSSGVSRFSGEIGEQGMVNFSVTNASGEMASNASVELTNTVTGETMAAQAAAGTVSFNGITPGTYVVSSPTQGLVFTSIEVMPGGAMMAAASSASTMGSLGAAPEVIGGTTQVAGSTVSIVGLSVVGVSAIAAAGVAVDNSSDSSEEVSPAS